MLSSITNATVLKIRGQRFLRESIDVSAIIEYVSGKTMRARGQTECPCNKLDLKFCQRRVLFQEYRVEETTRNNWERIRKIFEDALLQPLEGRSSFAKAHCENDEMLWNEVRSLLEWHDSSESFLETPAVVQVVENDQFHNQLISGQRLLHYEIKELIGIGGMGEVYQARDTRLDRNVAIKLLRVGLLPQAEARERLLREAKAAALLEHPNICPVYEISEADGFSFIVMQYVVGTTLDRILAGGQLNPTSALDIAAQIADGLAEAHSQGIVHRDIKPANVIVSEKGQAKILDFGLAKFIEAEASAGVATRLQSTGGVMGTVPYMSPEQLSGGPVDATTDVFSFGSLFFEMLTGRSAFGREGKSETVAAILNQQPDWSLAPMRIHSVIQKCLNKDRTRRFSTAGEIADALHGTRKEPVTKQTKQLTGGFAHGEGLESATNGSAFSIAKPQEIVKRMSWSAAVVSAVIVLGLFTLGVLYVNDGFNPQIGDQGIQVLEDSFWDRTIQKKANENVAIQNLRTLHVAEATYQTTIGDENFGTVTQLRAADLISSELGTGVTEGYTFSGTTVAYVPGKTLASYKIAAVPQIYGTTGIRSFFIDTSGVLRGADKGGLPADESDPPIENWPNGERNTIFSLRSLHGAEFTYQATTGIGNFGSLQQLFDADIIPPNVAGGLVDGYVLSLTIFPQSPDSPARFRVTAVPQVYVVFGVKSFFIDQSGVIRGADKGGLPADENDPPIAQY